MAKNMEEKNMQTLEEKLIRELRNTRIFCIISCVLMVSLLVGGFLVFKQVQPIFQVFENLEPAMEQFAELDVEEVNNTLKQVNATLESVDWQQMSDEVSQLDVDAFNDAIKGLNTEAISKAVENLNKAAAVMEKWSNAFGSIF